MDPTIDSSSEEETEGIASAGFMKINNISQVKGLQGRLVQFYYPIRNDYFIGYVVKVKERIRESDGKVFVRIYLKDCTKRKSLPYDIRLYNRIREGGKLDAGTILQYALNRDIVYKTM
jgi:hypothetical protein